MIRMLQYIHGTKSGEGSRDELIENKQFSHW